jgi:hypothetical protein
MGHTFGAKNSHMSVLEVLVFAVREGSAFGNALMCLVFAQSGQVRLRLPGAAVFQRYP